MAHLFQSNELSPRAVVYILFVLGLTSLAYAIIFQHPLIASVIICFPIATGLFIASIRYPRLSFLIYAVTSYYFTAIMRYSGKEGLSVILDALLVYMLLTILFSCIRKGSDIRLQNIYNALTGCYLIWILFAIIQFANPNFEGSERTTNAIRAWILGTPILYIICSLLADNKKTLKQGLIILGIFTITAFIKLLYQKYRWFDAAEVAWLMEGNWKTHLLSTGIRYFSLLSDAGNFGSHMGMITIIYSIVGVNVRERKFAIFCLCIAVMGAISMLMSGTRGAIVVPLGGLMLYCLICKNIKIITVSAIIGILTFSFFSFTDIGDDYSLIRRMRTAFRPHEDNSYQVRKENQERVAFYLKQHPWGAGFGGKIPITELQRDNSVIERDIPPDSFYVDIWMQTGKWGLLLYLSVYGIILVRGCYLIMFRVHNKELKNILAALICGIFGIWLNGYVGRGMGMHPSSFIIAASLAFIMNGPYMDKQLEKSSLNNKMGLNKYNKK